MSTDPLRVALPSTLRWVAPPAIFDPQRPDWWAQAACKGMGPRQFFPERHEDVRAAKAVCYGCPVRQQCLDWAIDNHETHGIFGGLSERQRRQIRPRRGAGGAAREEIA